MIEEGCNDFTPFSSGMKQSTGSKHNIDGTFYLFDYPTCSKRFEQKGLFIRCLEYAQYGINVEPILSIQYFAFFFSCLFGTANDCPEIHSKCSGLGHWIRQSEKMRIMIVTMMMIL